MRNLKILISVGLSFLFLFSLSLQHFTTFDSYFHMQVAKHYKENWFSTLLQKVGMVDLSTYPPLAHQILALIPLQIEISYSLLTIFFTILLSFYSAKFILSYLKISKNFWIIYFFVLTTPTLLITIYTFGQYTTVIGLTFSFISLYYFSEFLNKKQKAYLFLASLSFILTAYSHLLSFLILSIFYALIFLLNFKIAIKNLKLIFVHFFFSIVLIASIYYPIFTKQIVQKEIWHWSRYPLENELNVQRFKNFYGFSFPISLLLPFMILNLKRKQRKKILEIYIITLVFLILGLGTTTPFTKIFGEFSHWLTYERFLLIASILFSLMFAASLPQIEIRFKKWKFPISTILILSIWIAASINLLLETHSIFFQDPIKTYDKNIRQQYTQFALNFLNNVSKNYRYQTFGYGRPIGEIYFYSKLPTLDTDYFTGRKIEWIRESGIDEIDQVGDEKFLDVFLSRATNYSIKYIITFSDFYSDHLQSKGWKVISQESFGSKKVIIWENPENVNEIRFEKEKYGLINYLRGILPLTLLSIFIFAIIKFQIKN